MFTTTQNLSLGIENHADSTSISFFPGTVAIGDTILQYRGDTFSYYSLTNFGYSVNSYQYSIAYLKPNNTIDTTQSTPQAYLKDLDTPFYNSIGTYPMGLFLFYNDGTSIKLQSSSKIEANGVGLVSEAITILTTTHTIQTSEAAAHACSVTLAHTRSKVRSITGVIYAVTTGGALYATSLAGSASRGIDCYATDGLDVDVRFGTSFAAGDVISISIVTAI